jgi:hypothetical protein
MKTVSAIFVALCVSTYWTNAQTISQPALTNTAYAVVSKGANQQVWQNTTYETLPSGQKVPHIHQYTELATGLHYWNNGQWLDSKEEINILPNGTAAATNGQHQVYFTGNIYQGVITLVTPDGKQLQSRPLGLSFDDGTNTVLIAELTNSVGYLVGSNQVIYPDAFAGLNASLRYTYTKAGLEQDVLVQWQLPTPEFYGLNPATARLQVLTEFFDTNNPAQTLGQVNSQNGLSDTTLTFGSMKMVQGRAFSIGDTNQLQTRAGGIPTYKSWLHLNGRTILVEEVPYPRIAPQLEQLPASASAALTKTSAKWVLNRVSSQRLLPPVRVVQASTNRLQLAKTDLGQKRGLVLDYVTVNGDTNDFMFRGDTTYCISNSFFINGTMTLEGGTVIKLAPSGLSWAIDLAGPLVCQTSAYRPAIFTEADDDSVGEPILGSTGSPSISSGSALVFDLAPAADLLNVRFAYCSEGLVYSGGGGGLIRDCQFVNVGTAIWSGGEAKEPENVLFNNAGTVFSGNCNAIQASHLTIHHAANLMDAGATGLSVTNSLFVCVTNWGGSFTGAYNATNISDSGVFQTIGAGSHYLATNSPYRNAGTTNIDPSLLTVLLQKTTYPPIVYTSTIISTNLIFHPQAQRDTDTPDLGYHYDPIDYALGGVYVTNATVTVNPGTVIATFGTTNLAYGLGIGSGAQLFCQGFANSLNRIVQYNTVQEQAITYWGRVSAGSVESEFLNVSPAATIFCRFTDWSMPAQDAPHLNGTNGMCNPISLQDCQFHGGTLVSSYPTINLTNCLFERVFASLRSKDTNIPSLRNNLFWRGNFDFAPNVTNALVKDNLFDQTVITNNSAIYTNYNGGYNAFATNCNRLQPAFANDVILSNSPVYQSSWLGIYYQPPNSPLINAGSTNANLVGLYHFTTQTNQVKETSSIVSIGYHYVATDTNGNPIDTDGDGIPDYIEDANGDGVYGAGDLSDWTKYSTDGTGISDGWEIKYFGHIGIDLNADPDGDGLTNLQEYQGGTNPNVDDSTVPGSRLNYVYDAGGWLQTVSGKHSGSVSPDSEGNIKAVSQ